jgi:hypothetical protein
LLARLGGDGFEEAVPDEAKRRLELEIDAESGQVIAWEDERRKDQLLQKEMYEKREGGLC